MNLAELTLKYIRKALVHTWKYNYRPRRIYIGARQERRLLEYPSAYNGKTVSGCPVEVVDKESHLKVLGVKQNGIGTRFFNHFGMLDPHTQKPVPGPPETKPQTITPSASSASPR